MPAKAETLERYRPEETRREAFEISYYLDAWKLGVPEEELVARMAEDLLTFWEENIRKRDNGYYFQIRVDGNGKKALYGGRGYDSEGPIREAFHPNRSTNLAYGYERKMAEYFGFCEAEEQLLSTPDDPEDATSYPLILIISPPLPANNESRYYLGQKVPVMGTNRWELQMVAWQNDLSSEEHQKIFEALGEPTPISINAMLASPIVRSTSENLREPADFLKVISQVLEGTRGKAQVFGKPIDFQRIRKAQRGEATEIIEMRSMEALASQIVAAIKTNSSNLKLEKIWTAILWEWLSREKANESIQTESPNYDLIAIEARYGHLSRPTIETPCGGTGLGNSSIWESPKTEGFKCPKCNAEFSPGRKVGNKCPACGYTREQFEKDTGKKACA